MNTIIKSKNFILRPFKKGDEKSLAENINDKTIARNTLSVPYPYTLKDARNWIERNLKEKKKKNFKMLNFAIDVDGEVAGSIGFHKIETGHKAEVGYWLARKFWNKGIMTEALKLLTNFGFKKLGFKRLSALVFPFNKASMRILQKAGYKLEGIQRKNAKKGGKYLDDYSFAKINPERDKNKRND